MQQDRLSIGEIAKANHLSVQTVRLYSNLGLIRPSYTDPSSGYRYYDVSQSYVLDVIVYLKGIGFSLKEIQQTFTESGTEGIQKALARHIQRCEEELRAAAMRRSAAGHLFGQYEKVRNLPELMTSIIENRSARTIHHFPVETDFYATGWVDFERLMRDMKAWLLRSGLPLVYFNHVSTRVRRQDFLDGDRMTYSLFILGDRNSRSILPYETIEGGRYLCIYGEDFQKEGIMMEMLAEELESKKLKMVGDYICETVFELPLPRQDRRRSVICSQVPVVEA